MNDTQYNELITKHPGPWFVKQEGYEVIVTDKNETYVACMLFDSIVKATYFKILLETALYV
jgi:hypothetical protein